MEYGPKTCLLQAGARGLSPKPDSCQPRGHPKSQRQIPESLRLQGLSPPTDVGYFAPHDPTAQYYLKELLFLLGGLPSAWDLTPPETGTGKDPVEIICSGCGTP